MSRSLEWIERSSSWWVEASLGRAFVTVVLPAAVATTSSIREWAATDVGPLLTGSVFLAGAMVNVLLRVWSWADSMDAHIDNLTGDALAEQPVRNVLRDRAAALRRVQAISAWATLISIALIGLLIVLSGQPASEPQMGWPAWAVPTTAAAAGLGVLVALLLVTIVAETVVVAEKSITDARTRIGAQSTTAG